MGFGGQTVKTLKVYPGLGSRPTSSIFGVKMNYLWILQDHTCILRCWKCWLCLHLPRSSTISWEQLLPGIWCHQHNHHAAVHSPVVVPEEVLPDWIRGPPSTEHQAHGRVHLHRDPPEESWDRRGLASSKQDKVVISSWSSLLGWR